MECCVCENTEDTVNKKHTFCNHNICKKCYLQILTICYCKKCYGETLYICPLCRNEHRYSNIETHLLLSDLNGDCKNQIAFLKVHKTCENKVNDVLIKKCVFKDCGCRENIVDIISDSLKDISTEQLISVANHYN